MRRVIICMAALAIGTLFSSTLLATESNNLTANIVYKIGSKTYNGTTSGVLNVTPEPSPSPTPLPANNTLIMPGVFTGWPSAGGSDISWKILSPDSLQFTCPIGYGIPVNATVLPGSTARLENFLGPVNTYIIGIAKKSAGSSTILETPGEEISSSWSARNLSFNDGRGIYSVTCVPIAQIYNYS